MTMESRSFGQKLSKVFFGVICRNIPGDVAVGNNDLYIFVLALFFRHAVQQVDLSIFHRVLSTVSTKHD